MGGCGERFEYPVNQQVQIIQNRPVDRGEYGISLYMVDGGFFKDFISNRMVRKSDELGGWFVYDGCDLDYAEQVTAEEKVIEKRGNNEVEVWRPKTSHADNHYLDCEVYAAFAADCLGIRYMRYEAQSQPKPEQEKKKASQNSWIQGVTRGHDK